ncbi:porin family protein [Terriglobus tenax]|uniref:porin family protein n=1 Tax=Terriglobus tenax TaxID=1111115 RepID=UPI0021E0E714|nr:porin family protein [Terriglobus tenax]
MQLRIKFAVLAVALTLAGSSFQAKAQAIPTAQKRGDVDAFFLYGRANTDYGPVKNNVYTFGVDYMFRPIRFGQPGVNVRYSRSSGSVVDEPFFGGGLDWRFREHYHVRPYAVADIGVGSLKVKANGFDDSGTSYILGGGADIPITSRFAGRVEFDYQHIKISGGAGPDLTFTPYSINFGVVYRIK